MLRQLVALLVVVLAFGCSAAPPDPDSGADSCEGEEAVRTSSVAQALSTIDCTESQDTGYSKGTPFPITVVTVDGKKVEKDTANAYYVMAQAAAAAGVTLKVVSGFRTMAEQEYFYSCYINCNCNSCNLAAKPGYSNHQSGHALDLNTSTSGVYAWLEANAGAFGFQRTVPSEAWHWEWWGGGPGGGPCGKPGFAGESLGIEGQSYPIVSQGAVNVEVGQTVSGWVKLRNVGTETWKNGTVWLAPIPRDQPSPLASASWLAPHRISTIAADVAPGQVGEFALDLTGSVVGESILELGWVAEGITWFGDAGGPKDGYFAVKVNVTPASAPPPGGSGGDGGAPASGGSSGSTSGGSGGGWSGSGGSAASASGSGGSASADDNAAVEGSCQLGRGTGSSAFAWLVCAALISCARRRRR